MHLKYCFAEDGAKDRPAWAAEQKRAEDAWIGVLAPSLSLGDLLTVPQFIYLGVSEVSWAASVKLDCVGLGTGEILV